MAKVSSGLCLSTNYFMRNYYANNRDVIKTSGRNDYTKIELSFEDSRALTRASKRLLNEDLLKTANNSKVRKIFSPDQEYSKKAYSICSKFNNSVRDDIVSQINGKGLHINIAL